MIYKISFKQVKKRITICKFSYNFESIFIKGSLKRVLFMVFLTISIYLTYQSPCHLYNAYYDFQELRLLSLRRESWDRVFKTHLTIFITVVVNVCQQTDRGAAIVLSSSLFCLFGKMMAKEWRKGFNTANQALQINKQFTKMRQAEEGIANQSVRACLPKWLDATSCNTSCILLPAIKDQQIYLSIMSTFITLAREADAPLNALNQVANAVFSAKGFEHSNMLRNLKQDQQQYRANTQVYDAYEKGCSTKQMKNLLEKMEKEMVDARQRQKQYRCLQKYRKEKQQQIAPTSNCGSASKKDRFKRIVQNKYSKNSIQSSNFYEFDVNQILQNTYTAENQCYKTMSSFVHLKTMFGHASDQDTDSYSPVYNAIFDQSENLIITSGEQGVIKVWHRGSGTLIKNLKGHTDFLNKIDSSKCNKYILSSGGDGIRFFDTKTLKPLGGWKTNTIEQITSFIDQDGRTVFLFGQNSELYLLTEEVMLAKSSEMLNLSDFMIFSFNELIGKDNAAIIVISISPQKTHLLIGLETGHFLLVYMSALQEIMATALRGEKLILPALDPIKAHYQEIIEIKWSDNSHLWATGSKDGRCLLWELKGDQICLANTLSINKHKGRKKITFSCTYICWNCTYSHFAAGFQQNIEDEDAERGQGEVLVYSMKEKRVTYEFSKDISLPIGGIKAMDSHPFHPNILLICQSEGNIILFDLFLGCVVNVFEQRGYHTLHPQFSLVPTQCRFTRDGLSFIVASQFGSVSLYGYDSKMFYAMTPSEQFLQTDFTEIRIEENTMRAIAIALDFNDDINNYPLDSIRTIKGQPYSNILRISIDEFLFSINNPLPVRFHVPQVYLDKKFIAKIAFNIRQGALLDQTYQKIYEEIENKRQFILFHERQRQFSKVNSLTDNKILSIKSNQRNAAQPINIEQIQEEQPLVRTRKLKRHAQLQRVNYADDFSYNDSQEEDFDVIQQELPDQLEDDESDSEPEMQQPRIRRRQRTRIRRQTRQSNPFRHNQQQFAESNQQRMPTRSRNHSYNRQVRQDHEDLSQHAPRKKVKNEQDESQQPKKYSRLRKQGNQEQIQQPIDCYRCQFVKATDHCDKCKFGQQFCHQCAQMRGRRIKDKYKCLICIFLDNDVPQQHETVNQEIFRVVTRNNPNYLPQIEDKVRFFFQGYEEFLIQNIDKLNNSVVYQNDFFRLLPHTQDLRLLNTPLCTIKTIKYYFPLKGQLTNNSKRNPGKGDQLPILMLLGMSQAQSQIEKKEEKIQQEQIKQKNQIEQMKEQNQQQGIFWVYYIPGYQFLLPESIYSQIAQKGLLNKFANNQLIQIKDEQMQIVQISPFEDRYPQSIWKLIKIRKTQGKRLRGNTKEIERRINIWKVSEQIENIQQETNIEPRHIEILRNQIQRWITQEDSPYLLFVDYVDFDIYPLYRNQIPVGICLQQILQRLNNGYYTGNQSLKADFDMIFSNCEAFNGKMHFVTEKARQLHKILHSLLTDESYEPQIENQPQSISKKTQEQSNSKKQKKKKDSQDYIDPNYFTANNKRRTRRSDVSRNKKHKDSSQYNESQMSFDQEEAGVTTRGVRTKNYVEEPKRITRSRVNK